MRRDLWLAAAVTGVALALTACSHDFHLVDPPPGDGSIDAAPHSDARIDGAIDASIPGDGPIVPEIGTLGTDTTSGSDSLSVIGGLSTGNVSCTAGGLCVQGGLHP